MTQRCYILHFTYSRQNAVSQLSEYDQQLTIHPSHLLHRCAVFIRSTGQFGTLAFGSLFRPRISLRFVCGPLGPQASLGSAWRRSFGRCWSVALQPRLPQSHCLLSWSLHSVTLRKFLEFTSLCAEVGFAVFVTLCVVVCMSSFCR